MSEMEQITARLTRIEKTLDELRELVVKMAQIETSLAQSASTHTKLWQRLDEVDSRVRNLEIRVAQGSWIERSVWIVIAAIAAVISRKWG